MESLYFLYLVSVSLMLTSSLNINNIMIVGPKMCERLCKERVGCSSFLYSVKQLSCKLQLKDTTPLDDSFKNITLIKETNKDFGALQSTCPHFSKWFYSHSKILQCKVYTRIRPPTPELSEEGTNAKLLVYEAYREEENIPQVFLNNLTIEKIPFNYNRLSNLLYIPATKQFMIVVSYLKELLLVETLIGNTLKSIEKVVECIALADDMLFFVSNKYGTSVLNRMTLNGTNKRHVKSFDFAITTILADTIRSFLYIYSQESRITKVSYGGDVVKSFRIHRGTFCLAQDPEFLYYSPFRSLTIFELSISDGNKKQLVKYKIGSRKITINTISALGDKLFAVTSRCQLLVFIPGSRKEIIQVLKHKEECKGFLIH